ncbi:MAG: hypothetical protein C3F14_03330 [Deltaproteobacteria bacterium]|nr:MAG: hypothetical protein C3F14_03330 [Deltaproteobacteria bacterium]
MSFTVKSVSLCTFSTSSTSRTVKSRGAFFSIRDRSVRMAFLSPVALSLEAKIFTRAGSGISRIAPRTQFT